MRLEELKFQECWNIQGFRNLRAADNEDSEGDHEDDKEEKSNFQSTPGVVGSIDVDWKKRRNSLANIEGRHVCTDCPTGARHLPKREPLLSSPKNQENTCVKPLPSHSSKFFPFSSFNCFFEGSPTHIDRMGHGTMVDICNGRHQWRWNRFHCLGSGLTGTSSGSLKKS